MVARVQTVCFQGIEAKPVDVQVHVSSGLPAFILVGLPDKSIVESRERIRSALCSLQLALPAKRVTVNLSPAGTQKEGTHYDLPIALGLLCALDIVPQDFLDDWVVMGELALDGALAPVVGTLPAALYAASVDKGFVGPKSSSAEAAWSGHRKVLGPDHLLTLLNHIQGRNPLPLVSAPSSTFAAAKSNVLDVIQGQENAKRALVVAAAGGHNILLNGPPGAGKSMLASRLSALLPPLTPEQALEVTMIHSVAGTTPNNGLIYEPPFRAPHHSASMVALIGGGMHAKPGEVSLAHRGVLFLDELPEFSRNALEALRQPLETRTVAIARAQAHVTYPAAFQLVAAMNPCRCGYFGDPKRACSQAPRCAETYQNRLSGPFLERIDVHVDVPLPSLSDWRQAAPSAVALEHTVWEARDRQTKRFADFGCVTNAEMDNAAAQKLSVDPKAHSMLQAASETFRLSPRVVFRTLKLAKTIADLDAQDTIVRVHMAEALSYRPTLRCC